MSSSSLYSFSLVMFAVLPANNSRIHTHCTSSCVRVGFIFIFPYTFGVRVVVNFDVCLTAHVHTHMHVPVPSYHHSTVRIYRYFLLDGSNENRMSMLFVLQKMCHQFASGESKSPTPQSNLFIELIWMLFMKEAKKKQQNHSLCRWQQCQNYSFILAKHPKKTTALFFLVSRNSSELCGLIVICAQFHSNRSADTFRWTIWNFQ